MAVAPQTPPPPAQRFPASLAILSLLLLLGEAAEVPSGGSSLTPEPSQHIIDIVPEGHAHTWPISARPGTNPGIRVTLTPLGDGSGDADLYCSKGSGIEPGPDYADFQSEAIGVNEDVVYMPPVENYDAGSPPVYTCAVYNRGYAPASYKLQTDFINNHTETILNEAERAVAQQLFNRCCPDDSCRQWKLASERKAKEEGLAAGTTETDLCQFGTCDAGHLTQLNARGWDMKCPFPGDLFVKFPKLQHLYLSYNEFSGDINDAAHYLAALEDLQELGLMNNELLTGQLGDDVCKLVQGTVEMLQLSGTGLKGELPSCLFDHKSALYQFGASNNRLTGTIPDAFATATRLQVLDLRNNKLSGRIPPSLAAAPNLNVLDLSHNSLSDDIPGFDSTKLSVLNIASNKFTGAVPEGLAGHSTLYSLDLEGNSLTSLPTKWQQPPAEGVVAPLNYLRVSLNRLEGEFPQGLATYPNLTHLLLNENRLSGDLPDPVSGQFPELRYLLLDSNSFTGTLGDGWQMTGIWQLPAAAPSYPNIFSVSGNQLTTDGVVPAYMREVNNQVNVSLANQFSSHTAGAGSSAGGSKSSDGQSSGDSNSGSALSTGAVVGICVGIVLAAGAVAAVGLVVIRRQRSRSPRTSAVKFEKFLDEGSDGSPAPPPTFYETAPAPASPAAPTRGQAVEMSGSPSNV